MIDTRTIVALDFPSGQKALDFLKQFTHPIWAKVGMELFYAAGPDIVSQIKALGHRVFLDLKVNDIPNTVKGAMRDLAGYGADMVDLMCLGGSAMMRAAVEGLAEGSKGKARPLCLGVTVLTSLDEKALREELNIGVSPLVEVEHLARLAKDCGLDGCVCSPYEAGAVKRAGGSDFLAVTPGIRFATDAKGDQKRVATPSFAKAQGADMIVVGRSITSAADPLAAYAEAEREMEE